MIPGHSKIPDNDEAHNLSRKATELGSVFQLTPASKVLLLTSVSDGRSKIGKVNRPLTDFTKQKLAGLQSPLTIARAAHPPPVQWESKTACQRPLSATLGYKPVG